MSAPSSTDPVERLLALLEPVSRSGAGWKARCPAHDDVAPSLSIKRGDNGQALVRCHAGCRTEDVVTEAGLRMSDLFPDGRDRPADTWRRSGARASSRGSLAVVSSDEARPARRQRSRSRALGSPVATYVYCDEQGREVFSKLRFEPVGEAKTFRIRRPDGSWGLGDVHPVLYRLPEVHDAIKQGRRVWLVEGEKDADRLVTLGEAATCNHDGAAKSGQRPKWRAEYGDALIGADVVIVRDADQTGGAHALAAAHDLAGKAASVRVVAPATDGSKDDVSDHLDAGRGLSELVDVDLDALASECGTEPPEMEAAPSSESVDRPAVDGWARIDLTAILDGAFEPPRPGILFRADGVGLFYPGLLHQVIGQPESGKSWLVLLACAARLTAGERVLFLDFESDPAQVVARLQALGVSREALLGSFDYRRPEVGVEQAQGTFRALLATSYALVVIDGVTDAIGTHGGSISDNDDTGAWLRAVPERIARETGAAVILVDHVAKGGTGGPSRYAVGAQQKLGKVRGVSYYVEPRVPIAPGQVGELSVVGTKDTAGQVKRHGVPRDREPRLWDAARVRVDATDPARLVVEVRPPFDEVAGPTADVGVRGALYERNAELMERVSRVLETADAEMTTSTVVSRAKGKRDHLIKALQALVREEFVAQRAQGVAQLHTSRQAFREAADPGPPPPSSTPQTPGAPSTTEVAGGLVVMGPDTSEVDL